MSHAFEVLAGSQRPYLREADQAGRPALEAFIARRFAEVYDARLYSFMPRLFGLHGRDGSFEAAFGLRAAGRERLFLERYLERPIESYVAAHRAQPVLREHIVEVGNLAGATPGALRDLIPLLCEKLIAEGYLWIAFTGSSRLCNSFARLGLPLEVVAPAPRERLSPQERMAWGRYYDNLPAVMLGDLRAGRRLLVSAQADALADPLAPLATVGAP